MEVQVVRQASSREYCAELLSWLRDSVAQKKAFKHSEYVKYKARHNERSAKWYRENKGKAKEIGRNAAFKMKYGIRAADYDAMLVAQGYRCAVCRKQHDTTPYMGLQVDHCHASGKVRGLLCRRCNDLLGKVADNSTRLRALADYLDSHASMLRG